MSTSEFNLMYSDDSLSKEELLVMAASENLLCEVIRLVEEHGIDPSYKQNKAFRHAARFGHFAVVSYLMRDKRVNPADKDNQALKLACETKDRSVIRLLLSDARVFSSLTLQQAVSWNCPEAVALFLQGETKVHMQYGSILSACMNGYDEIVRLFLADGRADPNFADGLAILNAAVHGRYSTVGILLDDPRVQPSVRYNHLFQILIAHDLCPYSGVKKDYRIIHKSTPHPPCAFLLIKRLIHDPRVDMTAADPTRAHETFLYFLTVSYNRNRPDFIKPIFKATVRQMFVNLCLEERELSISKKTFQDEVLHKLYEPSEYTPCIGTIRIIRTLDTMLTSTLASSEEEYIKSYHLRRTMKLINKIQQERFEGENEFTVSNYLHLLPNELMYEVNLYTLSKKNKNN